MIKEVFILSRQKLRDSRGWFLKAITGEEKCLPQSTGEVYFISANPGESRGGHYHVIAREWFTLIKGKAVLQLVDIETHEHMEILLDAETPVTVFIPRLVAHTLHNSFDENFILCAYTDILYDPKDTIPYKSDNSIKMK